MTNRFDFEQMLMRVWSTKDDIDLIVQQHLDSAEGPLSEDQLTTLLMGVSAIHDARCAQTFEAFEAMVREGKIR